MVRNDGTAPYRSALQHATRLRGSNPPALPSLTTRTPSQAHSEERETHGFQMRAETANSATLRDVSKRNCERQRADSFHDLWILRKKATDLIHY